MSSPQRPRSRNVAEPPSPSTGKRSRSRSASTSVTRQSNRSATPRRDARRPHVVDEQVEDRSATWKRKLSRRWRYSKSTCSNPSRTTQNPHVRRPWYPLTVMSVPIWNHTIHAHPGLTLLTELVEMARRKRREVVMNYPRKPCKDGWMGPVPPEARDNEGTLLHNIRWWFYPCKQGGMPPFKYDGAIDQWRKTVMAFSGDRIYIMQRDDAMSTPIPRLTSYEDVEVMVVARPLRGAT